MFNWATEQLEKLSQTVAPPPDDPPSRFVYCVQKNDEVGAQGCLAEIDPLYTIVQSTKGTTPLHLACGHSMMNLIRQIMAIPGASMEVTDAAGNTPLHHASMSTDQGNALHTVRMLIIEYNASVVAKNWNGQTPYDVATLNGIRQYLLPIQLQQETQQAIDNGGIGLPPGIDMGGLRISQPAMPPPPIGGMGAPPTPPSAPPHMLSTPSPNMPPSAQVAPPAAQPTAPRSASTPSVPSSGNGQMERSASAPSSGNSGRHTYSRSGSSSAAVLSKAKFRPDGFHSSSSDVNLQKKYGHSSHGTPVAAIPPPPTSGNSAGPPAMTSSGANPYAAGSSAFGSANRYGSATSRYPVYGAAVGQPNIVAPPSSGGYGGMPQQQPVPSYAVFQPGSQPQMQQQQQQPAYQQPFSPDQQQQQPTTPFMSPPPYQNQAQHPYQQQQQQQPAYQQPQQSHYQQHFMPQPQPTVYQQSQMSQQPQQMNAYQQPPIQQVAQNQPYAVAAQSAIPGPSPMAHTVSNGNVSTASADEVFASPNKEADATPAVPSAEPATRTVTSDSARSSISSAQELFASNSADVDTSTSTQQTETVIPSNEAASQEAGRNSTEEPAAPAGEPGANTAEPPQQTNLAVTSEATASTAADFFGTNGTASAEPAAATYDPTSEKPKEVATESTEGLDDVPLEEVPLTPSEASLNGPTTSRMDAFSSVGLPPPPFSSRQ